MNIITFATKMALQAVAFEKGMPMSLAYEILDRDYPGMRSKGDFCSNTSVAELVALGQILETPASEILQMAAVARIGLNQVILDANPGFTGEIRNDEATAILGELNSIHPTPKYSLTNLCHAHEYMAAGREFVREYMNRR